MGRTDQRTAVGFDKDVTQEMGGTVMKLWIARTQSNELCIFREKPFLLKLPELICPIWVYETQLNTGNSWRNIGERIDSNAFPEVTFENSPMEVEIKIANNVQGK